MDLRRIFNRKTEFYARSSERDDNTDNANILPILRAIDAALVAYEAEHSGLSARMQECNTNASFIVGNETDEYLTRENPDDNRLRRLEVELKNGQRRLDVLQNNIDRLHDLRTVTAEILSSRH